MSRRGDTAVFFFARVPDREPLSGTETETPSKLLTFPTFGTTIIRYETIFFI